MTIHLIEKDDIVILKMFGDLSLQNTPVFSDLIYTLTKKNKVRIVINLKHIKKVDSIGLGLIIATHSTLTKLNGALKILHTNKTISRLFNIKNITNYIPIYNSLDKAILSFKNRSL